MGYVKKKKKGPRMNVFDLLSVWVVCVGVCDVWGCMCVPVCVCLCAYVCIPVCVGMYACEYTYVCVQV